MNTQALVSHYSAVRRRLMMPPSYRRQRLYDLNHYPAPIGPQRITMGPIPDVASLKTPLSRLVAHLCSDLDVTPDEVLSHRRLPRLVKARARIIHRLHQLGYSSTQIGQRVNRDHTSVLYMLNHYDANGEKRHA